MESEDMGPSQRNSCQNMGLDALLKTWKLTVELSEMPCAAYKGHIKERDKPESSSIYLTHSVFHCQP